MIGNEILRKLDNAFNSISYEEKKYIDYSTEFQNAIENGSENDVEHLLAQENFQRHLEGFRKSILTNKILY